MTGASLLLKDQKASNHLSAVFVHKNRDEMVVPVHHTRSVLKPSQSSSGDVPEAVGGS